MSETVATGAGCRAKPSPSGVDSNPATPNQPKPTSSRHVGQAITRDVHPHPIYRVVCRDVQRAPVLIAPVQVRRFIWDLDLPELAAARVEDPNAPRAGHV